MRKTGKVKIYRTKNGCGFITTDAGDVFVRVTNILENAGDPQDILIPGEEVEFDLLESRRGNAALRVTRLSPAVLEVRQGRIKIVYRQRGYGFIESTGGDVFFHLADTMFDHIEMEQQVNYLLSHRNGRPRAFRVRRQNG